MEIEDIRRKIIDCPAEDSNLGSVSSAAVPAPVVDDI
jgi:hypothetical protein